MPEAVDWPQREAAALALHEQERLGRQLHDTLGPQVAAISMLAASLFERLNSKSADETALAAKLLDRVEKAKLELRAIAKGLSPVEIDSEGLMSALASLATETESTFGVACRFECEAPIAFHDNFIATRLYRIAREAVHNAMKHADPNVVVIRLCARDRLVLEIHDDGGGFSDTVDQVAGTGIQIMRFRSEIIGATLDIRSDSDGTVVSCSVDHREHLDA